MSLTPSSAKVPYFVLRKEGGKAAALFTVPADVAQHLTNYPIMCRGSSFDLVLDEQGSKGSTSTAFLSTVFESPNPEETAREIAERLAIRIGNPSPVVSQMFGFH
jgi:hypothetical protein